MSPLSQSDCTTFGLEFNVEVTEAFAALSNIGTQTNARSLVRLEDEKTAPNGSPWKKNRAGTPILYREGKLAHSIEYAPSGHSVVAGSVKIYARIHQLGGEIKPKSADALHFMGHDGNEILAKSVTMPARPYLGISQENQQGHHSRSFSTRQRKIRQLSPSPLSCIPLP